MRNLISIVVSLLLVLATISCAAIPGLGSSDSLPALNQIVYDGAITLAVKNGQTYPGTTIGFLGKTLDGRARVTIGGQEAPKSTADSVNYSGVLVPGTEMTLNTRVGTYDNNTVNLFGTIHLVVRDPEPQMGTLGAETITAFGIPVNYNVNRGDSIPGSTVQYLAKTEQGAQFSNVEGTPYRQQLDSVVWMGHLRAKVAIRLDMRVVTFSDESVNLIGTAQLQLEK